MLGAHSATRTDVIAVIVRTETLVATGMRHGLASRVVVTGTAPRIGKGTEQGIQTEIVKDMAVITHHGAVRSPLDHHQAFTTATTENGESSFPFLHRHVCSKVGQRVLQRHVGSFSVSMHCILLFLLSLSRSHESRHLRPDESSRGEGRSRDRHAENRNHRSRSRDFRRERRPQSPPEDGE